ncbi:META domain-containing protein [Litoribrevibacter albus]|uniref:DUF306 domain-containing protein n=1 Tax=Litoribrevibacter albus TaxID=1473156 RepID=A0AA37SDM9_9GAMM|nr:META domain-containing protein [Litoribrevibacter albus]GLQ32601.1 hypothetical protein GCM10007876_30800 [Litoribrevibacter albus]
MSIAPSISAFHQFFTWILLTVAVISVAACSSFSGPDNAPLRETHWQVTEIFSYPVTAKEEQQSAYLQFSANGKVEGHSGCNQLFGQYHLQDSIIYFTRMASTRMACVGQADEIEGYMLDLLKEPKLWIIKGETLVLFNKEQQVQARFKSVY